MSQQTVTKDLDTEKAIQARLDRHDMIDCDDVAVRVRGRTAYIGGSVPSLHQKKLAGVIASRVQGVDRVVSTLRIVPQAMVNDSALRDRILRRIAWNPGIDEPGLSVTVTDQVVYLGGTVGTWEKRCMVEAEVLAAGGVARIVNTIEARSQASVSAPDPVESILQGLTQHLGIDTSALDVELSGGIVYLTGGVPSADLKYAAEDLARWTPYVTDVKNDLRMLP